jgi:hypothetical protein
VHFIERATGHFYDANIKNIPNIEKWRVSNITMPRIYEAIIAPKGDEVIEKTLTANEEVETKYVKLDNSTATDKTIIPVAYPANTDIVANNGDRVFYIIKNSNNSVAYTADTFARADPKQIYTSPLRDWLASWSGGDQVAIFTKPHSAYEGLALLINTKTGADTQILANIKGLTVNANPSATYFLYNSNPNNLSLVARKISDRSEVSLPITTLPEKCVWSKINPVIAYCAGSLQVARSEYPEKWYQGVVCFNDSLWEIKTEKCNTREIFDPIYEKGLYLDMTSLTLSPDEHFVYFQNKNNLSLWGIWITGWEPEEESVLGTTSILSTITE